MRRIGKRCAWATLGLLLTACAQGPAMDPPPAALRQRMDPVALRVFSNTKANWSTSEEIITDAGERAAYASKKAAATGAKGSLTAGFVLGCNPDWRELWILTCPAGIVVGIGGAIGTAIVGGAGGAIYGSSTAPTPAEVDAAVAGLDKAILDARLESALRDRMVQAINRKAPRRVVTGDTPPLAAAPPAILALEVVDFSLSRTGRLSPDLWLNFVAAAAIYNKPEDGPLYRRRWRLFAKLGGYFDLTKKDAAGLRRAFDRAFEKMSDTITEDIFLADAPAPIRAGENVNDKVVTIGGSLASSDAGAYRAVTRKAACGDTPAQLALGHMDAATDARIYGWRARERWVDAYVWLRLAQNGGEPEVDDELRTLTAKMTLQEIETANARVSTWTPSTCPAEPEGVTAPAAPSAPPATPPSGPPTGDGKSREEIEQLWRARIEAVKQEGPYHDCEMAVESPGRDPAAFGDCEDRADKIKRFREEMARALAGAR